LLRSIFYHAACNINKIYLCFLNN